jgi:hypothetical protein
MNLATAPKKELIALIVVQQKRIAELEKRIAQLEHKIPPSLPFHPKPSITVKLRKPKKARVSGFARKLDTPTEIVIHKHNQCPDCQNDLHKGWISKTRQIIDLPLTPATITEHRVITNWCSHCKKKVSPILDLSDQVLGNHRVSLRLMSYVATLKETYRQPFEQIQQHLQTFYQLNLSVGELTAICHTVAQQHLPLYQSLPDALRASPAVHGDETGWREDGINGYVWNFSTQQLKYLTYDHSRSSAVVKRVMGEEYDGVIVSDFFGSYNIHDGYHQRCWVHLLRDIKKLTEAEPDNKLLKDWASAVIAVYQKAKTYNGPDPQLCGNIRAVQQQRVRDQAYFRDTLLALCRPHLQSAAPMRKLCQRIDKFQDELFVFISHPNVPSDNNSAERSLRHTVISRKISGGTRSKRGSKTKFILASMFGTWHLQGKNPFQACLDNMTAFSTRQTVPLFCS